jgi:hypothetical protein
MLMTIAALAFVASCHESQNGIHANAQLVTLENGYLQLGLDARTGQLREFNDLTTGQEFIAASRDPGSPWQLQLDAATTLTPADARAFRWETQGNDGLRATWSDFSLDQASGLRVAVTLRLRSGEPMSDWMIVLEGLGQTGLEELRFPRIPSLARLGNAERLAVPRYTGELAGNPRALFSEGEGGRPRRVWSYPGELALQALAFYQDDGPGLYAAAADTAGYRKAFAVWGDGRQLGYELIHFPENPGAPREEYSPPYSAVLGSFRGDWITAAERYRDWGTQQTWARDSRLRRGLIPEWLLDTGMWMWNRGRVAGVLPPAVALQQALGLPVSVQWHWWHGGPYDTSFPEYLPPRDGTGTFEAALRRAQAEGVRAIVYMNQRLWCTRTRSWEVEGAEPYAVKNRVGTVRLDRPNAFDRQPCAPMCITQKFWHDRYAGLADTVFNDFGVDGIYMDQAVASLPCFDATHGHPLGGGNYWIKGFQRLADEIRRRATDPTDLLLAGEHAAENWLPTLDLFLTLQISQERYIRPGGEGWDVIPFFQAVYHPYAVTYGSYSSLTEPPYDEMWPAEYAPEEPLALLDRKYARQFYLEQARAFVWGMQPTIANFLPSQMEERPKEVAYMLQLARVRAHALKYLLHGTFLRSPSLEVPQVDVEFSRLSIYAGRPGTGSSWQDTVPAVITAVWQAADGDVALALASITDEPLAILFEVDPRVYGLTGPGTINRIDEMGAESIGEFGGGPIAMTLEVPALGARLIEISNRMQH